MLEYDPLSWLKEEADDLLDAGNKAGNTSKAKPGKATPKGASLKQAEAQKAASKKQAVKKTAVKTVKAKKAVEEKPPVQAESATDSNVVEGAHFGFFDDDEPVQPETDNNTGGSIFMGSELTIKNIAQFKQAVDENLAQGKEIRINPTELQKIDTAGLQLLFCLQKSLQKSGHQIDWVAKSEVVESASKIIGIENLFDNAAESIEQDQGFGFF